MISFLYHSHSEAQEDFLIRKHQLICWRPKTSTMSRPALSSQCAVSPVSILLQHPGPKSPNRKSPFLSPLNKIDEKWENSNKFWGKSLMAHVAEQTPASVPLSNWSSILSRLKGLHKIQVCRKLSLFMSCTHYFHTAFLYTTQLKYRWAAKRVITGITLLRNNT